MIGLTQEVSGFNIFPSTVLVFLPFAFLATVIEVEHRADGINPNPVDMVFVKPE
jgi:hypothetical protein